MELVFLQQEGLYGLVVVVSEHESPVLTALNVPGVFGNNEGCLVTRDVGIPALVEVSQAMELHQEL